EAPTSSRAITRSSYAADTDSRLLRRRLVGSQLPLTVLANHAERLLRRALAFDRDPKHDSGEITIDLFGNHLDLHLLAEFPLFRGLGDYRRDGSPELALPKHLVFRGQVSH